VLKQALLKARGTTLLPAFLPALPGGRCGPDPASPSAAEGPDRGGGAGRPPGLPAAPSPSTAEGPTLEVSIPLPLGPEAGELYAEAHRQVDRLLLTRVLEYTQGNQHQAARLLGISRDTLRRRLRELGLHFTRQLEAEEDDQP
jgi:two-component system nitrogen regulation response regulator GlnG